MNTEQKIQSLNEYTRLANYFSAAQIFLKDNFFLERELENTDIKERLLGHWGTCPGISLTYAHTNRLIIDYPEYDFMLTVGPGHGFPAFQSGLFLEGSLTKIKPEKIPYAKKGAEEVIGRFSVPYGYPSHLNPEAPGVILEGGELGYSLSVAAGSVLDNKKLINVCIIGDGEAETGTIASAWHVNKFISTETDGVVLPVLHLNGYKISGPTIFGRMSDSDIEKHFSSLGWTPYFVVAESSEEFNEKALPVFEEIMQKIKDVKNNTENGKVPAWPMLVMRTPKGMTATENIGDKKIVGNNFSHQIVFDHLPESESELEMLQEWLESYKIDELMSFSENGEMKLSESIENIIPEASRQIGRSPYAHGEFTKEPVTPEFSEIFIEQDFIEKDGNNAMKEAGKYMKNIVELGNEFRLFSPDETYSNKLYDIFDATKRVWQMENKDFDLDFGRNGKVIEMLSENVLFGMMWGYTLTGRYGYLVSYEAFAQVVASMADQYVKFIKIAKQQDFRKKVPAMNIILSSLLERQDHNGFSHQNPSFIAATLDRDRDITSVYLPADKNLMKLAMEKTMHSFNSLNVIVCGKKMSRTWLTLGEAQKQADDGIMIWDRYSNENPDVVVVTAGDYVTEEAMAGMQWVRSKLPELKIRFVNIFTLDVLNESDSRFGKEEILNKFLTRDKGVVFNYHGYPDSIKKLLFDYGISERIIINGYEEHGSTTSPFDMKARNGLSRFQLLRDVAHLAMNNGSLDSDTFEETAKWVAEKLEWERNYIIENRVDPDSIKNWEVD
ncbi:MAG: phosphoketolase family protein [Candidatus Pacebacteria bacterium]|nr:phosphoketolase family protein [Candidatus Paceibacterota bacterium]